MSGERSLRVTYLDHMARLSGAEIALVRLLPRGWARARRDGDPRGGGENWSTGCAWSPPARVGARPRPHGLAQGVRLHASILSDPLNTSVLEGMGAGVPVVATDTGGHVEYMSDGREGLLHRPGDTRALAGVLRRAAGDPELGRRIAAGARERARELAPAPVAQRWSTLYRALSGGRRMG